MNQSKASRNEETQPITSNNNSRPIFLYHVRNGAGFDNNQAGFDNTFINGIYIIYLGISKMSFTF